MYRLVACDVDGTLLSQSQITPRTKKALRRAIESGLTVVLVSARAPRSIKWVASLAEVGGFAICMNGALIYDLDNEETVQVWPLPSSSVADAVKRLREELPEICFHWEKESGFGRDEVYESLARPLRGEEVTWRMLGDVLDEQEPIAKLVARHHAFDSIALAERAEGILGQEVLVTISDSRFIEITAAGVTKASALAWLCDRLGVDAREVIAFGDMTNDLPMLSWAGHGVAMGNGHESLMEAPTRLLPALIRTASRSSWNEFSEAKLFHDSSFVAGQAPPFMPGVDY